MAKIKYIFASKMQFLITLFSSLFVVSLLAYISLVEGETLSIPILIMTIGLMIGLSWIMWRSYKGELPLLRIEEKTK